jgi:membrane-bound metal-dependent hydrolase YbcI (DUF457 family)
MISDLQQEMDNVTHTLFAATLARTPIGRAGRGTTAALILASNAPDIDIVATAGGAISYLQWHRGPTHGPLGVVALGLITAGLVCGGLRLIERRAAGQFSPAGTPGQATPARFGPLVLVSMLGVVLHILMDLPTSYGTRLLSPFDWHWYAFDWMPIIDVYLLIALAAGLTMARSAAGRRRNALLVLVFMAANYGVRAAAHERAIDVAPRVFGALLPGACAETAPRTTLDRWPRALRADAPCLVEIAATPGFSSPLEWRLIAKVTEGYYVRSINLLDPPSGVEARLVPNRWTPAVVRAAGARPAEIFLGFSRFPAVRVAVDHTGSATIQWTDIRFSGGPDPPRPQNDGRGDLFGANVQVAPDGRILHARLGGR